MNPNARRPAFFQNAYNGFRPLVRQYLSLPSALNHFQYFILTSMLNFPFFSCNSQKFHIEPRFDSAMPFKKGIAAVKQDPLWGFIDTAGNWVFTPKFKNVQLSPNDQYLVSEAGDESLQLITRDASQNWILTPYAPEQPEYLTSKGTRLIAKIHNQYALTDDHNKPLTEALYDTITYLGKDLFIGNRNYKSELLNSNGKIISAAYTEILPTILFDRIPCIEDHQFGLLSVDGSEIIKPCMTQLEIAGHCVACSKGGKMKLHTDRLELLSDFEFDRVTHFENGNWIARNSGTGESKLFSPSGKVLSDQLSFGYGDILFGMIAAGNQNGLWGYVNGDGKEVIPFQFKYAESFMPNGKAVIWKEGQGRTDYFLIDTSGKEISSPPFDKIEWHPDGVYTLEYNNQNQLLDENFSIVTKLSKDPVEYLGDGVYIKYKASRSTKVQTPNFYTGAKFKIYRSWDVEPVSFHTLDGQLLLNAGDVDESEPMPSVSEGFVMAKKAKKWGFIKTGRKMD
ncbi:MAG: WG repeat-containing protein [Saprospiraceae bacterium]|nr:WG repeat-containing protein [Saprospiraceae bacterium]